MKIIFSVIAVLCVFVYLQSGEPRGGVFFGQASETTDATDADALAYIELSRLEMAMERRGYVLMRGGEIEIDGDAVCQGNSFVAAKSDLEQRDRYQIFCKKTKTFDL